MAAKKTDPDTSTVPALRREFAKAINELKAQVADGQRVDTLDFTILDALASGEQDNADPAWLHATPAESADPESAETPES